MTIYNYLTFREMQCSMDNLKFSCTWSSTIQGATFPVKLSGIQLEGCTFDGSRLVENQRDSPIVSSIPDCIVAWVTKVNFKGSLLF